MPDEQPKVTEQAPPLTTKEVIHQLRNLGGSNLTKLYKQESYEAIKESLRDVMDVHPNPDAITDFLPQFDFHLKSLREQKKAYGGTVQKLQSGGSVEDRAEPTITQMQQQAGLGQSPTLPTGGTVSYTDITPTAAETLAITPLGTPSQITPQATTTAQQITTPTKTAAGAAAEVPIEGAGAVALPEVTAETGTMTTGAQITDPQGTVSTDA